VFGALEVVDALDTERAYLKLTVAQPAEGMAN
jgi:hypothetical protein